MDTFDRLEIELVRAYTAWLQRRALRRRRMRIAGVASAALLVVAGSAVAAVRILGEPAPDEIKAQIAAIDQGMPDDLRLNPDAANARSVAESEDAVLYAADLKGGGYCTEIATGGRARGAVCTTASEVASRPIEISLPSDDQPAPDTPVVLGGRVNAARATQLQLAFGGQTHRIDFGSNRFFVYTVPADSSTLARQSELKLSALDNQGQVIASASVPADWSSPAVPDSESPLFVNTKSDSADFTKVYGIEGFVGKEEATRLVLEYRDGEQVDIPIASDRSYSYSVPADRVDAFMVPQTLIAYDSGGNAVATARVAAVAFWRGRHGG